MLSTTRPVGPHTYLIMPTYEYAKYGVFVMSYAFLSTSNQGYVKNTIGRICRITKQEQYGEVLKHFTSRAQIKY